MEWLDIALENLKGIEPFEVVQALAADRRLPRPVIDPVTGLRALTIWARTDAGGL